MQKLVRKLSTENDLNFEEICSFETDNYIGIWDHNHDRFVVFAKSSAEFWLYEPDELGRCENLEELYNAVYKITDEYITGVSDSSDYTFTINEEE